MRLRCPYCGERSNDEFTVLGDADAVMQRPTPEKPELFQAYVYDRANPAGRHRELWFHHGGCRRWLTVTRDTRTHEIFDVAFAGAPLRPGTASS